MRILLAYILILSFASTAYSQQNKSFLTPGGVMDTVFDRFGNKYPVSALKIDEGDGRHGIATAMPTCTAGMFVVYFGMGSGMENLTNPLHGLRRTVMCEVLSNISGLLGYNSSYPATGLVRILVDDVGAYTAPNSPSQSGILGVGTGYYLGLLGTNNPNPGTIDNLVHKTILSKHDAWTALFGPLASMPSASFYHGMIAFNFQNPAINWNCNINALPTSSEFDLYTVMLHEVTHMLGFASLIGKNGVSVLGSSNNYYSQFDRFLNYRTSPNSWSPLLQTQSCSSQYGLTFSTSSVVLNPSCTPNYQPDVTNCNSSIIYSSNNLMNMPIYTPNCYEAGSSLSHFEDMCFPTNNPSNNNQYFVMANASLMGVHRRFLKEEERKVFCDLKYSVTSTYTSNALSATTTYTGFVCNQTILVGVNDGLVNNNYVYTSTGGVITIPVTGSLGVITNDYGLSVAITTINCVDVAMGGGSVQVVGSNILYTPSSPGLKVLRYIPNVTSGVGGNITYVYCFVYPAFCGGSNPCDMVQNGGFESNFGCGSMPVGTATNASCWLRGSLSPDLYVRNCNNPYMPADLGNNTCNSNPTLDSHNGAPNNAIIGVGGVVGGNALQLNESFANYLGAPIVQGGVYNLSFWAYQFIGSKTDPDNDPNWYQPFNTDSVPAIISFATNQIYLNSTTDNFPFGTLQTVKTVSLSKVFNQWQYYNVTFTATNTSPGQWLYIGMDKYLTNQSFTVNSSTSASNGYLFYTLFDDISIKQAELSAKINIPDKICTGQSINNLEAYVNIPGGVFTGSGITTSTVSVGSGTAIQYHFNNAQNLPPGTYYFNYSYTNNINCVANLVHQVTIGNLNNGIVLSTLTPTICSNTNTISVVSPSVGFTYTFLPGNFIGTQNVVSVASPIDYTVLASNGGTCQHVGIINVKPNAPWVNFTTSNPFLCPGNNLFVQAYGDFDAITWQPNGITTASISINPNMPLSYTVVVSKTNGCTATNFFNIQMAPALVLTVSTQPSQFCIGNTVTVSVSGANIYKFNGLIGAPSSTFLISQSLNLQIVGSSFFGCKDTANLNLVPLTFTFSAYPSNSICAGESVTLTAQNGANAYTWPPYPVFTPQFIVTPNQTKKVYDEGH